MDRVGASFLRENNDTRCTAGFQRLGRVALAAGDRPLCLGHGPCVSAAQTGCRCMAGAARQTAKERPAAASLPTAYRTSLLSAVTEGPTLRLRLSAESPALRRVIECNPVASSAISGGRDLIEDKYRNPSGHYREPLIASYNGPAIGLDCGGEVQRVRQLYTWIISPQCCSKNRDTRFNRFDFDRASR